MSSDEHHDKLSLDELIRQIDEEVLEEIKRRGEKGRPEFRYMAKDIAGYWYNAQYPPDTERYGTDFHGYPTDSHETFFYNFAVQGYDVSFKYKGEPYYLLAEWDHAAVCDEHFSEEYQTFPDPNTLLEQYTIDGRRLIDIIDDLTEVEAV